MVDSVDQPWLADWNDIVQAQQRLMDCLAPSGVFGDYSRHPICKPAANWVPIPVHIKEE